MDSYKNSLNTIAVKKAIRFEEIYVQPKIELCHDDVDNVVPNNETTTASATKSIDMKKRNESIKEENFDTINDLLKDESCSTQMDDKECKRKEYLSDESKYALPVETQTLNRFIFPIKQSNECSHCSAKFQSKSKLNLHILRHTGERCSSSYNHPTSLKNHLRTHTGEKPYQCKICNASFTLSSSMKRHEAKHQDLKPFSCSECGHPFHDRYRLKRHQLTHYPKLKLIQHEKEPLATVKLEIEEHFN